MPYCCKVNTFCCCVKLHEAGWSWILVIGFRCCTIFNHQESFSQYSPFHWVPSCSPTTVSLFTQSTPEFGSTLSTMKNVKNLSLWRATRFSLIDSKFSFQMKTLFWSLRSSACCWQYSQPLLVFIAFSALRRWVYTNRSWIILKNANLMAPACLALEQIFCDFDLMIKILFTAAPHKSKISEWNLLLLLDHHIIQSCTSHASCSSRSWSCSHILDSERVDLNLFTLHSHCSSLLEASFGRHWRTS